MANTAKKAILRAKIEGVVIDLMVKSNVENIYYNDSTTLAAKLADIITEISDKANSSDVTTAIAALRTELMGGGVPEAYDTFKELADYIETHQDAADALVAAVGNKAEKSTVEAIQATVDALGALSKLDEVSEDNLSAALKEKVNAAADGNHSHENKDVLDDITEDKVEEWDGKANIYYSATEPENLKEGDLWVQLVEE